MSNPLSGWSVNPAEITLTGTGLRRPECVLAQPSGDLWTADLHGGVGHIAPDGSQRVIGPRNGGGPFAPDENPDIDGNQGFSMPNGLCFDGDGAFVIANFGTNVVEHLARDGHWSLIADTVLWADGTARPIGKANFPAIDTKGRLWFSVTASAEAWQNREKTLQADGYIAVIDDWQPSKAATARVAATGLGGANELRFSADDTLLYVAETGADHMTRFRVQPDGTLTGREIYGPERLYGAPDGFAFDAHGNLWTTLIGQEKLVAITPEGDVLTLHGFLIDIGRAKNSTCWSVTSLTWPAASPRTPGSRSCWSRSPGHGRSASAGRRPRSTRVAATGMRHTLEHDDSAPLAVSNDLPLRATTWSSEPSWCYSEAAAILHSRNGAARRRQER